MLILLFAIWSSLADIFVVFIYLVLYLFHLHCAFICMLTCTAT